MLKGPAYTQTIILYIRRGSKNRIFDKFIRSFIFHGSVSVLIEFSYFIQKILRYTFCTLDS